MRNGELHNLVLDVIKESGSNGITGKEIREKLKFGKGQTIQTILSINDPIYEENYSHNNVKYFYAN